MKRSLSDTELFRIIAEGGEYYTRFRIAGPKEKTKTADAINQFLLVKAKTRSTEKPSTENLS